MLTIRETQLLEQIAERTEKTNLLLEKLIAAVKENTEVTKNNWADHP